MTASQDRSAGDDAAALPLRQAEAAAHAAYHALREHAATGDPAAIRTAVRLWREALVHPGMRLMPAGTRAGLLIDAGNAFLRQAEQDPGPDGLGEGIACYREAIELATEPARRVAAKLNLAAALRLRAAGRPPGDEDFGAALELLDECVAATGAPARAMAWTTRGHLRMDQYHASADTEFLRAADADYRAALRETAPGSAAEYRRWGHLGLSAVETWRVTGRREFLDRAVEHLMLATELAGRHGQRRGMPLTNRATALMERFEADGRCEDLDLAVDLYEQAVSEEHPGSAEARESSGGLCAALARRHELTGDPSDLRRATGMARDLDGPALAGVIGQFPPVLLAGFAVTGDAATLDSAIFHARAAVAGANAVRRPMALDNLAAALSSGYDATGDLQKLVEVSDVYEQAVRSTPDDAPRRLVRLANLADALRERAHRDGGLELLNHAVRLLTEVVAAAPVNAPARAGYVALLATALLQRHRLGPLATGLDQATDLDQTAALGRAADLGRAIVLAGAAVAATPADAPDRPARLGLHGACLLATGRTGLFDQAVELLRESVADTPRTAPLYARHLQNLGYGLARRAQARGDARDRDAALTAFEEAWALAAESDPAAGVSAGWNWGHAAGTWADWLASAEGCLRGLATVWRLAGRQEGRRGREAWLRDAQRLPAGAALTLAKLGSPREAVRVLEAGRGVLLATDLPVGGGPSDDAGP
ncbi:hypothetical protein GCM10009850_118930 [Nonomuraea monospora]|uniref:Tetratricopeptide repeat protein n=1 Tax=Nonomuraea monospora TaxID=568818 RepID=A0ABN3D3N6_9ACTN